MINSLEQVTDHINEILKRKHIFTLPGQPDPNQITLPPIVVPRGMYVFACPVVPPGADMITVEVDKDVYKGGLVTGKTMNDEQRLIVMDALTFTRLYVKTHLIRKKGY